MKSTDDTVAKLAYRVASARHWLDKAEEIQTLAEQSRDPVCRVMLAELANRWIAMAERKMRSAHEELTR